MDTIQIPDELLNGQLKTVILYIVRSKYVDIEEICFTDDEYKHIFGDKGEELYRELVKEGKILLIDESKFIGKYNPESDAFLDEGGYAKKYFTNEFSSHYESKLMEVIQKDLLLRALKYLTNRLSTIYYDHTLSTYLFRNKIDRDKVRQYIDELSEDNYIIQVHNRKYTIKSYNPKGDTFLEKGGYVGEYYRELTIERDSHSLQRKKDWLEKHKTNWDYRIKRYIYPIVTGVFILFIIYIFLNAKYHWDWLPYNKIFKLYDAYKNGELEEVTKELFQ